MAGGGKSRRSSSRMHFGNKTMMVLQDVKSWHADTELIPLGSSQDQIFINLSKTLPLNTEENTQSKQNIIHQRKHQICNLTPPQIAKLYTRTKMGATNNSKAAEILEYDEKMKKRDLVVNTITQRSASSTHQILQEINQAAILSSVTGSSKVEAIVLSGVYTNYSYKIFVPDQPHLCLFAKLTFERAVWNAEKDAHYDLQRTVNEYELMETFSKIKPDCVVAPLALWDVEHEGQKMKLFVTYWSKADEQLSNQFIDGSIDPRIAPKLANALAAIHSIKDYDPRFNEQVKSYMDTSFKQLRSSIEDACVKSKPQNRTETYCAMMGTDLLKIIDANHADFHKSDCLIHSDSHAFNILVEAKPDEQDLDLFAPDGTVVLCDW